MPDGWVFPSRLRLSFDRRRRSFVATHRLHMAWLASITLDGELAWVRLLDHACCNSACIAGDRIVHASACGEKVTLLAADGRILATKHVPHANDAFPDGRGGLCIRTLRGVHGIDERLEPTWSLATDEFPHAIARDGILHVVTRQRSGLQLNAYSLVHEPST